MSVKKIYPSLSSDGFIMPYAILALVILSLLGIMLTRNSSTESLIAGNVKAMKINFYSAEGAAMKAARAIENENDNNLRSNKIVTTAGGAINFYGGNSTARDTIAKTLKNPQTSIPNYNTLASSSGVEIVPRGVAPGASLDIGTSERTSRKFSIFGVSNAGGKGRKVIEIGYVKTISLIE